MDLHQGGASNGSPTITVVCPMTARFLVPWSCYPGCNLCPVMSFACHGTLWSYLSCCSIFIFRNCAALRRVTFMQYRYLLLLRRYRYLCFSGGVPLVSLPQSFPIRKSVHGFSPLFSAVLCIFLLCCLCPDYGLCAYWMCCDRCMPFSCPC